MQQLKVYQHSGKVPFWGLILGLVTGGIAALILGPLYGYSERYIPFVYLNAALAVGAASGSAAAAGYTMRMNGVRSLPVIVLGSLLSSILCYYLAWVQWVMLQLPPELRGDFVQRASHPEFLWSLIVAINETGTWSMGGAKKPENGLRLSMVWAAEALLFLYFGSLVGRAAAYGVFCERCAQWLPGSSIRMELIPGMDISRFLNGITQGEFDGAFAGAAQHDPAAGNTAASTLRIHDQCCTKCRRTRAITVEQALSKVDKSGKTEVSTKRLLDRLLLDDDQSARLDVALGKIGKQSPQSPSREDPTQTT